MSFNPNFPQANTVADAAQMRAQLNSLKTLAENAPAGPKGDAGLCRVDGVAARGDDALTDSHKGRVGRIWSAAIIAAFLPRGASTLASAPRSFRKAVMNRMHLIPSLAKVIANGYGKTQGGRR